MRKESPMRKPCFRILGLLAVLLVTWIGPRPAGATVFCFITGQECVACGPDLVKKCTYRECTDGTSQTSCTGCSLTCFVG
jgi:hypothetical protein